jgi:hypothetical protein
MEMAAGFEEVECELDDQCQLSSALSVGGYLLFE